MKSIENTLTIDGVKFPVVAAELHLPVIRGSRLLYLRIVGDSDSQPVEVALGEIELPLLESLHDLDGQRIHVRMNGEAYDDDTLGTDIIAMMNNDCSEWTCNMEGIGDGELCIDFRRVEGRRYSCAMEFKWVYFEVDDEEDEDDEIDPEKDYNIEPVLREGETVSGRAEFTITVDEVNPFSDQD